MKDQKITRKKLIELYNHFKSCSKWKEIISEVLITNCGTTIAISGTKLQEAFSEANDTQKKLIEKYFKIEKSVDVCSKIRKGKFEDILKLAKKELKDILPWKNPKTKEQISQNALVKIQLASSVYNGKVVLDFNNSNQKKYYNWWYKVSGDWGLVSYCCWHSCCADLPFGLYFAEEKFAKDFANKFPDIYKEYLP